MKMHSHLKSKGMGARVNNHHVIFELKQRVVLALNKIGDRDTYEIGVEELGRAMECLTADGVSPFLSCILDTDSEQKIAVRKECIRLMGALATFHQDLIGPHLGKMVASIVKRLKDPDSVVRDECIQTMGILASKFSTAYNEPEGSFVLLVRPLFEALGEQNKHVQCGSALCLSRVIDHTNDPPSSILQRMLIRTTKMLKNPHFMSKPAVIELNRSIIQAGGASTRSTLTAAMSGIQEALKNSDWRTRKAASAALAEIASSNASYFGSFKTSCIRSLELCRFDKVKPVRDTVLEALQLWKSIVGTTDASELSEAGSSIKGGDYSDISNTRVDNESVKKRVPLSVRKTGRGYVKANDWHVEVSVPKTYTNDEESEGSCVTKTFERTRSTQDIGYEYVPMDDKQECSSASNKFETNLVPVVKEEISTEEESYFAKIQAETAKEMTCIREKLLEIENKQSNLLDLMQVFATKTMDSLSMIQLKVSSLEDVVDRMVKKSYTSASPRLSTTCTPRRSVGQLPLQPMSKSETWADSTFSRTIPMVKSGRVRHNNTGGLEAEKLIKGYLLQGDLDSAYVEALTCGDDLLLIDLLHKTGPVLERLSNRTANDILTTLAFFLSQQQFITSVIPWLQQVVELSSSHGANHLVLTAKARRDFLCAIQQAVNMEFPNATHRRSITQLLTRLHQVWGKCS